MFVAVPPPKRDWIEYWDKSTSMLHNIYVKSLEISVIYNFVETSSQLFWFLSLSNKCSSFTISGQALQSLSPLSDSTFDFSPFLFFKINETLERKKDKKFLYMFNITHRNPGLKRSRKVKVVSKSFSTLLNDAYNGIFIGAPSLRSGAPIKTPL